MGFPIHSTHRISPRQRSRAGVIAWTTRRRSVATSAAAAVWICDRARASAAVRHLGIGVLTTGIVALTAFVAVSITDTVSAL